MPYNEYRPYMLVVDTNVMFSSTTNGADFTTFELNQSFENLRKMIIQLELKKWVSIMIPEIVWREFRQQNIENYCEKRSKLLNDLNKFKFPDLSFNVVNTNYNDLLDKLMSAKLDDYILDGIIAYDMPVPNTLENILERAISKLPPFEGKNGKSDKGFKDAVLWESILNYKRVYPNVEIYLYTNDAMFNSTLVKEYFTTFNQEIHILRTEESVLESLQTIYAQRQANPEISERLAQDIRCYHRIFEKLTTSDEISNEYISWMNGGAYGNDVSVIAINGIEVTNITKTENQSRWFSSSEYLAVLKVYSKIKTQIASSNEEIREFCPQLLVEVGVDNETEEIKMQLTGITSV